MEAAGGKVLEYGYPGTDTAAATTEVVAAIAGNPDLTGIYATHESAGLGAAAGLKDQGKQDVIKLISFDSAPSQVNDLKKGVYDALIAQQPYAMGYNSVKLVADTIRAGTIDTDRGARSTHWVRGDDPGERGPAGYRGVHLSRRPVRPAPRARPNRHHRRPTKGGIPLNGGTPRLHHVLGLGVRLP